MLDRPSQFRPSFSPAPAAPLLMLPGTLCDERLYAGVLAGLGTDAVIVKLKGAETAAEMAHSVIAGAPARFSLCGFSLGAIIALEIIAQAPERVERLALIGCNPGVLDDGTKTCRAALSQEAFATPDDLPLVRAMARDGSPETYRQQTGMTLTRQDSRPRLSRIDVPTLVMCGADDRVCPPEMSRTIAAGVPGSVLRIVPGAGHYLPLERPETVAAELSAWLAMPATLSHAKELS